MLANSLGATADKEACPYDFVHIGFDVRRVDTYSKLKALDYFRDGEVERALDCMRIDYDYGVEVVDHGWINVERHQR